MFKRTHSKKKKTDALSIYILDFVFILFLILLYFGWPQTERVKKIRKVVKAGDYGFLN